MLPPWFEDDFLPSELAVPRVLRRLRTSSVQSGPIQFVKSSSRDDGGNREVELQRVDVDAVVRSTRIEPIHDRLPTGCFAVLTCQKCDPNATFWKENRLAQARR